MKKHECLFSIDLGLQNFMLLKFLSLNFKKKLKFLLKNSQQLLDTIPPPLKRVNNVLLRNSASWDSMFKTFNVKPYFFRIQFHDTYNCINAFYNR